MFADDCNSIASWIYHILRLSDTSHGINTYHHPPTLFLYLPPVKASKVGRDLTGFHLVRFKLFPQHQTFRSRQQFAISTKPTMMSSTHEPGPREQDHDWLPDTLEKAALEKDMDFPESSFFQVGRGRKLPAVPKGVDSNHQGILVVSEMRLLIKFGPHVTIDEAVTMRAVRKRLTGSPSSGSRGFWVASSSR